MAQDTSTHEVPTHATISLRISTYLWADDARRAELLALLRAR